MREIDRLELHSYPPGSPLTGRADWRPAQGKPASTLDAVRGQCLDHFDLRYAICNTLYGAQIVYSEYLGGALCRGINEWMRAEWLDKEPRLRASIVVSLQNPDTAAEEIERLADDKRFVQVLVLAAGELPLGRKYYWPIYKAAEKHGLPIGIHAGSAHRHAPSQSGWYSNLVEDYAAQAQHFAGQLLSLAAEGVFSKFPELKFVLIESGVTWLPGFMWRFSKDWRGVRVEVPWVKEVPAQLFRDHVRLTVQPLDAPSDPADVGRHLGSAGIRRYVVVRDRLSARAIRW